MFTIKFYFPMEFAYPTEFGFQNTLDEKVKTFFNKTEAKEYADRYCRQV